MFLIPRSWYTVRSSRPRLKSDKGRAVFAQREIPPGTLIGDYLGKIVRPDSEDELKDGLYSMWCNPRCDIVADPKVEGMHLLNHSCANNCEIFPYKGHMLVCAGRRIFKGEELTINYALIECEDKRVPCMFHACRCGSQMCLGTMHAPEGKNPEAWGDFVKRRQGAYYRKLPAPYGKQLPPLERYPKQIGQQAIYNSFGTEKRSPATLRNAVLPATSEISKHIRETGRQLKFPRLHLQVCGVRDGMILGKRI